MIDILNTLPESEKGVVVILSGGMDSTIATRLAVEKYGKSKVHALSFDYGQRQRKELFLAKKTCNTLGITHQVIRLSYLQKISMGFSANVDRSIKMPTIKEVLGDAQPPTYVPFRNMQLLTIAAAYAETANKSHIICGLQVHDEYGYYDTTQAFVDAINNVLNLNRINKIKVIAPFAHLTKKEEIQILQQLDDIDLLKNTLTCYDPNKKGESCGKCPSCSERIMNFAKAGLVDPIAYQITIPWGKLLLDNYTGE